jgi:hypothetical protein
MGEEETLKVTKEVPSTIARVSVVVTVHATKVAGARG